MPALAIVFASLLVPAPKTLPLHAQIDALIESADDFAKHDAGPADDAEFCRRLYLDLTGRLPTPTQARAFFADPRPNKHALLIDALLDSPEHARHLATFFDVTLMERLADTHVPKAEWTAFLYESFKADRPWDEIAGEILSADTTDLKARQRVKFFLERGAEPNRVTRDISRLFLGMNLQCAQCHDHPLVEDYKQADYYGLFAFVNRTSLFVDKAKKLTILSEKADGDASFQSVFDPKKMTQVSLPRVPGGRPLAEPKLDPKAAYIIAPSETTPGVPTYSRRARLASQTARLDYEPFRRNLANRLWGLLFGRGLVEPLDMIHRDNPAVIPEVLDAISADLLKSKLSIRHTLRQLANTRAYRRSSMPKAGSDSSSAPPFAVGPVKPLTPEQLAWSFAEATGLIEGQRLAAKGQIREAELYAKVAPQLNEMIRTFANQPGTPASFEARADQALYLANGATLRSWLVVRPGSLLERLGKLSGDAQTDELYLSILIRLPDAEERRIVADALRRRPDALPEIAWGLLASTEFRFNH